jgi:exosortase
MDRGVLEYPADTLVSRIKLNRVDIFLALVGFIPLLWGFFLVSWQRPAYQFFPLAMVGAALLIGRAAQDAGSQLIPGNVRVTKLLTLITGILFLTAYLIWSPWLGFITFLLGSATVLWGIGGKPLLKAFLPAGLILLAIVPPPMGWDQLLTLKLRSIAVNVSCSLLDCLRVTQVQDGNTVQLPGKNLFVEEACSGINSFILCNVLCLFWMLWNRRPVWWTLTCLVATSIVVVLGNLIRITTCAAAAFFWQVDLLSGWQHETFGLVLLLGYCGLILSFDQLMFFLTELKRPPQEAPDLTLIAPVSPLPPVSPRTYSLPLFGFKFVGVFLALIGMGLFSVHVLLPNLHGMAPMPGLKSQRELGLTLPVTMAGWQRFNTDAGDQSLVQSLGVHSTVWRFQNNQGMQAAVCVDYPLDGFHNVKMCYINNGWQELSEEELHTAGNEDLHALKLSMDQSIRNAVVYHSVVDERGNWLSPKQNLTARFANSAPPVGYRIQLIIGDYAAPSVAEANATEELFLAARQALVPQIVAQLGNSSAK